MSNQYVTFITDEDLLECVATLYHGYRRALSEKNLKDFMKNRIDPIKFTFDANVLGLEMDKYIQREIVRQADKTISNYIGDFHEQVLGKIQGYQTVPVGGGIDIISDDGKLVAEIKNKHNTVKGENLVDIYKKLENMLDDPHTDVEEAYYVRIIDTKSQLKKWTFGSKGTKYGRDNIFIASGDKFYEKLTGNSDAFAQICSVLPKALEDFISSLPQEEIIEPGQSKIIEEIKELYFDSPEADVEDKELLTQLFKINFPTYNAFSDFTIED